jgi:hypothetical protein
LWQLLGGTWPSSRLAAGPDDSVDFIPASTRGDRSEIHPLVLVAASERHHASRIKFESLLLSPL